MQGAWSTSRPGRFTLGGEARYSFYRRLVLPRAGLDGFFIENEENTFSVTEHPQH